MFESVTAHPLVPAVIVAAIAGVVLLRYLNKKRATPKKHYPPRPSKRKKRR